MADETHSSTHRKALIGNIEHDFWIYDSEQGFDLTRPSPPTSSPSSDAITLTTTSSPITIDPAKSAMVIIDMQNFFLSTAMGRPSDSKGLKAQAQLLQHAIPATRKASIQIVWVNWGLTEDDLERFPPSELRAFGFSTIPADEFNDRYSSLRNQTQSSSPTKFLVQNDLGKDTRMYKGPGQQLGDVNLPDGKTISAGRMLMRGQWNTALSPELEASFKNSLDTPKPDIILDKIRVSGMHKPDTPTCAYLKQQGIKTLFFGGVNTDQCVNGTITDAFCQGYDCVMLRDGCATTSPQGAQECVEFNVGGTMGFLTDCEGFARDIEASLARRAGK